MRDLSTLIADIRTDLDEHDHLTRVYGVEPSDRVDVRREDVEALLAIAEAHAECHTGFMPVGPDVMARAGMAGSGGRQ